MGRSGIGGCNGGCGQSLPIDITFAFQPIVDAVARSIVAYEALVRGPKGESAGSVLARVTDDIRYSFDQACRVKAIEMAAARGLTKELSINFMPNAIYDPQACLRLSLNAARKAGFPTELITFEFTEEERVTDRTFLGDIVRTYKANGFQTAIDDFGSGWAGLSLLIDFPPDKLKIDRHLIDGIATNGNRKTVVRSLVEACRHLGVTVVAEGVERVEDFVFLRDIGIRLFQGYLFARPALETFVSDDQVFWPETSLECA